MHSLGIYLSVPFCKAKCSFCNFASDVFAADRMQGYVDHLCDEIRAARSAADRMGALLPQAVDSVYFGGGTPSLLAPALFRRIFETLRGEFDVEPVVEITVECAPGQLADATLVELLRQGVDRLSFGVQSFVDLETAAVGRTHTRRDCLDELARVGRAGFKRLSVDLIAGLPHQTEASWLASVDTAIASGVEHVSVYMLEIDEDSRLGREALAQGMRYHAPHLPSEDATADWYLAACERLDAAGIRQYEISNFARPGGESRHNLKYWERDPYVGFGMDAHSMLMSGSKNRAIRWANTDDLNAYTEPDSNRSAGILPLRPIQWHSGMRLKIVPDRIGPDQAFEEALFLGLRLNRGIDLENLRKDFGGFRIESVDEPIRDAETAGLIERQGSRIYLTARGRMASNEVFSRLLLAPVQISRNA